MSHSQFSLLKTRQFLPLFVTQFLGAFNDNVFKNALIIMMTYQAAEKVSVDPRLLVTASAGIFILPFFLFSAMAGQLADKFEKSRMIRIVKFIEIPLMAVATIGFYFENYWLLMGVLFCAGTHSTFFGPLKYSILPDHLKEDELIGGNALVEAGTFLAILLGTIAGGVLILRDGGTTIVSLIITGTAITGWAVSRKIPLAPAAAKTRHTHVRPFVRTFSCCGWRLRSTNNAGPQHFNFPSGAGLVTHVGAQRLGEALFASTPP
jgi:acyl-[acyl-carrier-protein]-phospholipid O-acyltransferase/long-chain-fatty-acid--[acyl-carrier-protein] ligase